MMTMARFRQGLTTVALVLLTTAVHAQSDFGMRYNIGAEKKFGKKFNVSAEAGLRTRNSSRTLDRFDIDLSAEYKIIPWLRASGGYQLLVDNRQEKITYKDDGVTINKWTPSFWMARHRFNIGLMATVKTGRLEFSLRERWQYTYRKAQKGKKLDLDEMTVVPGEGAFTNAYSWEDANGKGANVLRSRLKVEYDIPKFKFDPHASVEMFNGKGGIQKMRYEAGVDYKLKKKHVFGLNYRFQSVSDDEDDEDPDMHSVGVSYKFKF